MPVTDTVRGTASIHVLHVGDNQDVADLIAEGLESEDDWFTVETVTSTSEGLDRLASDDFNCIVSNDDISGQNGIEFLKDVREEYPSLPFIFYTENGTEEIASEAISDSRLYVSQHSRETGLNIQQSIPDSSCVNCFGVKPRGTRLFISRIWFIFLNIYPSVRINLCRQKLVYRCADGDEHYEEPHHQEEDTPGVI